MGRPDTDQEKEIEVFYCFVVLTAPWGEHTTALGASEGSKNQHPSRGREGGETVGKSFLVVSAGRNRIGRVNWLRIGQ